MQKLFGAKTGKFLPGAFFRCSLFFKKLAALLLVFLFVLLPLAKAAAQPAATTTTVTTIYVSKFYNISSTDSANSGSSSAGTTITKHIFGNGTEVGTVTGTGPKALPRYVHTDQLTGSNIVTNSSGTVDETLDYFPFGKLRIDSGTYSGQRKFIGQEYDPSTGLNYLNARYYNSTNGQFISQDLEVVANPQKFLSDPQQLNYYSYGRDNPINITDPTGRNILGDLVSSAKSFIGQLFNISGANSFVGGGQSLLGPHPETSATRMISAGVVRSAPVITKSASAGIQLSGIVASVACEGLCSQFVLGGSQVLANNIQQAGGVSDPNIAAALGIKLYRGGDKMNARPGVDVKVDENGMVSPTRGVTVYSDPAHPNVAGHGIPHEIDTDELPEGLKYVQQGSDPTHYEIPSSQSMPFQEYQELLNNINRTPFP